MTTQGSRLDRTISRQSSSVAGRVLCLGIFLAAARTAEATSLDGGFHCYPTQPIHLELPKAIHGGGKLTHEHTEDLLWTIGRNRMDAAGHFTLAEVGCATDCIHLASIDLLTGNVHWLPQTISSWPIKMLQPVSYRGDSRLVIVSGQLNEHGTIGPFRYLLGPDGFRPIPDEQPCPKPEPEPLTFRGVARSHHSMRPRSPANNLTRPSSRP